MIEQWTPDLLTLSTTFYDLSVSCDLFSNAEMRQFGASGTEVLKGAKKPNLVLWERKETLGEGESKFLTFEQEWHCHCR